jgi:GNAT superfamily N-acetyltransferase
VAARVAIRPYEDADEEGVLDLLNAALGGGPAGSRPEGFFRWKHLENPFGRSFMLVAESDGRIVGLRAFMRWEFVAGDRRFRAVRAVDTATHPDYQGRGIFSRLTLEALGALRDEADFVFNTPNEKSLPGYLKMGWQVVGRVPIQIKVRRPFRFVARSRSWRTQAAVQTIPALVAPLASEVLTGEGVEGLLATQERPVAIATSRDTPYLTWRYGDAPLLDYRSVVQRDRDRVAGLSIFRIRARGGLVEGTVAEVIVRGGDTPAAGKVLRAIGRSGPSDHLACSFARGSTALTAARRLGYLRAPGGMMLVVNPLGHDLHPDPLDLTSWALTVGDLEVF